MKAIIIKQAGGPEVLEVQERPMPVPKAGEVLIEVRAFGVNQAEIYFRLGVWGEVAEISGIECVGVVKQDASGKFELGQKVLAMVGGMGRSINGSYAEYVAVPATSVVAIQTDMEWEKLAALPESYATAWLCLHQNLEIKSGQTLLIRGATSALGQAALNIAVQCGAHVIATTRKTERVEMLLALGAREVLIETPSLQTKVRELQAEGIDAALDLVGNTTILDSLVCLRNGGRACLAGFLGGGGPLMNFEPVFQIPSGRHLSVFASALVLGTPDCPITNIPFQEIVDHAASGVYRATPARVFEFDQIQAAHRLLESGLANGKVVVKV